MKIYIVRALLVRIFLSVFSRATECDHSGVYDRYSKRMMLQKYCRLKAERELIINN